MIYVTGQEGTPEYEAALSIRDAFAKTWPGILESPAEEDVIKISAGLKLSGHKVSDIDIVIVGLIRSKRYVVPRTVVRDTEGNKINSAKIRVKSFVAAIEVKDHPAQGINIEAGGVAVKYGKSWKNATGQNEDQRYALLEYLRNATAANPWIYRCIVLRGIDTLPRYRGQIQPSAGAVARTFDATSLLVAMATVNGIPKHGNEHVISASNQAVIEQVLSDPLFEALKPTTLDRRRMDRIAARPVEARELAHRLGLQRIHLRGNGGTGKTILLLQTAYEAYLERSLRCLVLTYNTALAADIQRTLALMGIPSEEDGGGISVRTVMSFLYQWLNHLGLIDEIESGTDEYDAKCKEALDYISDGGISQNDIHQAIASAPIRFDYDAILVDEAQDWPQAEADLLARLYGPEKISLADGISQLVRGARTDWRSNLTAAATVSNRRLQVGLRMKANLCTFANAFAEEAGQQWRVTPNSEAAGGRIMILHGEYNSYPDLQENILASAISAGNMPIDLLHCVPASSVINVDGRRESRLAKAFHDHHWQTWDAVDEVTRRNFPRSREALRIVQYESCRGLEGWTTVLDGLDDFWETRMRIASFADEDEAPIHAPVSSDRAKAIAWRWCMIPITRPIDTLVITIRDDRSIVGQLLSSLASRLPDIIQVHTADLVR